MACSAALRRPEGRSLKNNSAKYCKECSSSPLTGGTTVSGVTGVETVALPVIKEDAEPDVVFGPSMTVGLLGPTPNEKKEPAVERRKKTAAAVGEY